MEIFPYIVAVQTTHIGSTPSAPKDCLDEFPSSWLLDVVTIIVAGDEVEITFVFPCVTITDVFSLRHLTFSYFCGQFEFALELQACFYVMCHRRMYLHHEDPPLN